MGTLLTPPLRQPVVTKPDSAPPRWENGDHLSAEEFMRRYEAMPEVKAELIDGIVHLMAGPVRHDRQAQPLHQLLRWLGRYEDAHPELISGTDGTLILGNERPQPDAYLIRPGGPAFVGDDGFIHGPPDLVCEVAASTASIDAHEKADAYAAAGIPEYLLWRTNDRPAPRLDWFYLQDGLYHPIEPDEDDVLESRTFPGLRLARRALLSGDLAQVLAEVRVSIYGWRRARNAARGPLKTMTRILMIVMALVASGCQGETSSTIPDQDREREPGTSNKHDAMSDPSDIINPQRLAAGIFVVDGEAPGQMTAYWSNELGARYDLYTCAVDGGGPGIRASELAKAVLVSASALSGVSFTPPLELNHVAYFVLMPGDEVNPHKVVDVWRETLAPPDPVDVDIGDGTITVDELENLLHEISE